MERIKGEIAELKQKTGPKEDPISLWRHANEEILENVKKHYKDTFDLCRAYVELLESQGIIKLPCKTGKEMDAYTQVVSYII